MAEKKTNSTAKDKIVAESAISTPETIKQVGEEIVTKKKRTRPDSTVQPEPGDNTKYTNHNLQLFMLPKVNMASTEEVGARVEQYFTICAENDMKPSVAGLALALGIDRTTLWDYRKGNLGKNPEVTNLLKRSASYLNALMEDYMQNGKINPVSGIFLMKNNLGYVDKQEHVLTPAVTQEANAEELENRANLLQEINE